MQRGDNCLTPGAQSGMHKIKLYYLCNTSQVPVVLYSVLEMGPTDYIIFTHQLEERAQQMGPLLITTSTCSKGESGGLRQHVLSCVIGF